MFLPAKGHRAVKCFILFSLCIINNKILTLSQQNAHTCSFYYITLNIATCFCQQRGIIRESNQNISAWNQISHFSAQLTWCNRVRWLKYKHICVEWLYKCVGSWRAVSWQQPTYLLEVSIVAFITLNECHFLPLVPPPSPIFWGNIVKVPAWWHRSQQHQLTQALCKYLMSENMCILGKAGVSQDQRSHHPICPMRNVHVVLPNMAWSLVLTPALYQTSHSGRIISRG